MGKTKREKRDSDAIDENQPQIKKVKTEEPDEEEEEKSINVSDYRQWNELSYDQKLAFTSVIAKPIATRKLAKKLFKLIRKSSKLSRKTLLRVGLKDVQLKIRKGEKGLVVFAGDVTPIEVMCHLPAVCEEKDIPYVYVPLKSDISNAVGIKRPALMVMIKHSDDYNDLYRECETEIKALPLPVS